MTSIPAETLKQELRDLADELGKTPTQAELNRHTDRGHKTYCREFGGWNDALEAAGLEPNQKKNKERVELECDGPTCDETVEKLPSSAKKSKWHYCGRECLNKHKSELFSGTGNPVSTLENVKCAQCGETIKRPKWMREKYSTQFCSQQCRIDRSRGENHPQWVEYPTVACESCGEEFTRRPAHAKNQRFCSVECKGSWQSDAYSQDGNPIWSGGRNQYMGPNWPEQRLSAIVRDQGRCQDLDCGITEKDHFDKQGRGLDVHHITPRAEFMEDGEFDYEKANRLDNLVTLCGSHHKEWEHKANRR